MAGKPFLIKKTKNPVVDTFPSAGPIARNIGEKEGGTRNPSAESPMTATPQMGNDFVTLVAGQGMFNPA